MIKYGSMEMTELKFNNISSLVEKRGQWIDIYLKFDLAEETPATGDFTELGALIICNSLGEIIQYVALDEGCDSEYEFTGAEKEQIERYVRGINPATLVNNG